MYYKIGLGIILLTISFLILRWFTANNKKTNTEKIVNTESSDIKKSDSEESDSESESESESENESEDLNEIKNNDDSIESLSFNN